MRAGIVLFLAAACAAQDVSSGGAEAPLAKWTQEVGEEFAERVVDLALRTRPRPSPHCPSRPDAVREARLHGAGVTNMQVPFSVPRERVNLDVDATTDQTVELSGMTYGELARWKDVIEGHRAFWDQYLVETARLFDRVRRAANACPTSSAPPAPR